MADEAARFAVRLNKNLGIPVELMDERLTTWAARETMGENRSARTQRRVDEVAAAILLREYLGREQGQQEPVPPGEAR